MGNEEGVLQIGAVDMAMSIVGKWWGVSEG
jgi:hypothetical protein